MPEEKTTEEAPITSKAAIEAAVFAIDDEGNAVAPKEDSPKTPEDKKEPEPKKQEEDPEELANALQLYKALKNPETSGQIVELIAKQGGFVKEVQKAETKAEVKEIAKDLGDLLKESLGTEFEFLADKLAPALKKYLTGEFEKQQADIRESLDNQERERLQNQSSKILTKISVDFFGEEALPDNVSQEMSRLMDKIPAQPDMSTKEYLELIFDTAKGRLGLTKVSAKDREKESRKESNRTDAASRLASDRGAQRTGDAIEDVSKIKTRRQAIEAAMASIKD